MGSTQLVGYTVYNTREEFFEHGNEPSGFIKLNNFSIVSTNDSRKILYHAVKFIIHINLKNQSLSQKQRLQRKNIYTRRKAFPVTDRGDPQACENG
jgi:hypothetical protein